MPMHPYPLPPTESVRLADRRDRRRLFSVPIALVTLMDAERQRFKANVGAPVDQNARTLSFCAHTIMAPHTLAVGDLAADPRFHDHPLVAGAPHVRFYAGSPLVTDRQECVGTVCLLDFQPRTFAAERQRLLERLARQTVDALESRRLIRLLAEGYGQETRSLASSSPRSKEAASQARRREAT